MASAALRRLRKAKKGTGSLVDEQTGGAPEAREGAVCVRGEFMPQSDGRSNRAPLCPAHYRSGERRNIAAWPSGTGDAGRFAGEGNSRGRALFEEHQRRAGFF